MVLAREEEEGINVVQEKQASLREWAKLEIVNRIKSGKKPSVAIKETLDFALILGKLGGMNKDEKLSFFTFCEDLEYQF